MPALLACMSLAPLCIVYFAQVVASTFSCFAAGVSSDPQTTGGSEDPPPMLDLDKASHSHLMLLHKALPFPRPGRSSAMNSQTQPEGPWHRVPAFACHLALPRTTKPPTCTCFFLFAHPFSILPMAPQSTTTKHGTGLCLPHVPSCLSQTTHASPPAPSPASP